MPRSVPGSDQRWRDGWGCEESAPWAPGCLERGAHTDLPGQEARWPGLCSDTDLAGQERTF